MNHAGCSVARRDRCIRIRMRATPVSKPRPDACMAIPRPTSTPIQDKHRRQRPVLRMNIESDGVGASGSTAFLSRMLQFGDSMFPVGAFAFSAGLESAIQGGVVTDAATLRAFARTALEQAARGDGIALIAAHRAAA